jgi:hypothetical protein
MTALEQSIRTLEEAQAKIAIIEKLKAYITHQIMSLVMLTNHVSIELPPMGLSEAIKYLSSLKLLKASVYSGYGLKAVKDMGHLPKSAGSKVKKNFGLYVKKYESNKEDSYLFGFIDIDGTTIEVSIPINDIGEPVSKFKHNGSTTRSKIVGLTVLRTPKPFTWYINWSGIHNVEYFV